MLAPSVESEMRGVAWEFAVASRDAFPRYLARLEERTRIPVPLNRAGIVAVGRDDEELAGLVGGEALSARDVAEIEPALRAMAGGVLYPHDGCVDPLLFLDALRMRGSRDDNITIVMEDVLELRVSYDTCEVLTDGEQLFRSETVVLAAGAWTPGIVGVPRALPIEPVRGQMVAFDGAPLRHVVYGAGGYVIPKADGTTMAGSTMERAGFAPGTTAEGIAAVSGIGRALSGALDHVCASWSGLRPVTPDMLPILGRDVEHPNVIYACGHSRNGMLLAPLTGEVVADLVSKSVPKYDVHQFRPERF
jgi:glycine oxidase